MTDFPSIDWAALGPVLAVSGTGIVILLVDLLFPVKQKVHLALLGLIGLGVTFFFTSELWSAVGKPRLAFNDFMVVDRFSLFFTVLFLIVAALVILLSVKYIRETGTAAAEYYSLLLLSTAGMMIMTFGTHILTIILGLEVMSIAVYVLVGSARTRIASSEAAIKYFILGAFSTAILLYGTALIYGQVGSGSLEKIIEYLHAQRNFGSFQNILLLLGFGFLLVGFGFKIASVPFHMWAPDVYQGAPTPITAFMSVGIKSAAFAVFLRIFIPTLISSKLEWVVKVDWFYFIYVLSILTMVVGNIAAIFQQNIKRMLAYSSIAHAGYLLVGVTAHFTSIYVGKVNTPEILFYLAVYAFMNIGAFGVLSLLEQKDGTGVTLSDYTGAGYKYPILGIAMAIFMFSLAGVPPMAGFMGKFYIFGTAVKAAAKDPSLQTLIYVLVVIAVLASAVSAYYYLRVTVVMYMREKEGDDTERMPLCWIGSIAVGLAVLGTLYFGLLPDKLLEILRAPLMAIL